MSSVDGPAPRIDNQRSRHTNIRLKKMLGSESKPPNDEGDTPDKKSAETTASPIPQETGSKRSCTFTTAAGKRCMRAAKVGDYCTQHYRIASSSSVAKKLWLAAWLSRQPMFNYVAGFSSIVGVIIALVMLIPQNEYDAQQHNQEIDMLRNMFYLSGTPAELVIKQCDIVTEMGSSAEALLIKAVTLAMIGKKAEAESIIDNDVHLPDKSQERLAKKLYSLYVGTYSDSVGMTLFTSETFVSQDGNTVFLGPNLAEKQYKDWLATFDDIWIVLPLFNTRRDYSSAPKILFDTIIEKHPGMAWAWAMRAKCHFYYKRYHEALADASKALELEPMQPYALRVRALAREFLGSYEDALDDYNASLKLLPGDAVTLLDRGVLLRKMGRPHEAIKDYTESIRIGGYNDQVYINRGGAYVETEQYPLALRDFSLVADRTESESKKWLAELNYTTALVANRDWQTAKIKVESDEFSKLALSQGDAGKAQLAYARGLVLEHAGQQVLAFDERVTQWEFAANEEIRLSAQSGLLSALIERHDLASTLSEDRHSVLSKLVVDGILTASLRAETDGASCAIAPFVLDEESYGKLLNNEDGLEPSTEAVLASGLLKIVSELHDDGGFSAAIEWARGVKEGNPGVEVYDKMWDDIMEQTGDD